jgi:hypothetical protein
MVSNGSCNSCWCRVANAFALLLVLATLIAMNACGSGSSSSSTPSTPTPPPPPPPPPVVAVSVSPNNSFVPIKATKQFTATVTGSSNTAVTWFVDGTGGGNATVGTISAAGLYTAPAATGQHTVMATSVADTTKSASVTLTVQAVSPPAAGDITADFNVRSGGAIIPAGLFGSQLGNTSDPTVMQTLVAAGISGTRLFANVESVFATAPAPGTAPIPNFTLIDPILDRLKAAGMRPILMISDTPVWLQPNPNPCSELPAVNNAHPFNAAPIDNSAYASIAAQYVAHLDQKYPGLVQFYEFWNEADETNQFCGLNAGDTAPAQVQARLNEYKALYKAAALAMKQQAATDGTSILVGGPALGNSNGGSDFWFTQLVALNTGSPTRLVDFVSYHQYLAGADVFQTITWDGAGGTPSLLSRTLSPTTGTAAVYKRIAGVAASAGPMPVVFDEFNDDFVFSVDCCKDNPNFSPIWNTMVFTLILDTVYSGAPPVEHLSYYSSNNPPSFCLIGNVDNGLFDCSATGTQGPYPQFRAFELLASPNLLGLQASGGNVTKSLSQSTAMNAAGLLSAAFYTPASDAVVMVNPTSVPITNAVLVIGNHGLNNPTATQFLLNGATYSPAAPVAGAALPLTTNGLSVQATVTVPPLSVLAVKVTGQ